MAPTASGSIKMVIGPTKKYLKDKMKISYESLPISEIEQLHDKILKSLQRFSILQNELLEITEDAETNESLIMDNEALISDVNEFLTDLSHHIRSKKIVDSSASTSSADTQVKLIEALASFTEKLQVSENISQLPASEKFIEAIQILAQNS
mgnify:CR=1 FL=1